MDTITTANQIEDDITKQLADTLTRYRQNLNLDQAVVNLNYPLFVNTAGDLLRTKIMVLSPKHGVLIFAPVELIDQSPTSAIEEVIENVEAVMGEVMAKLVKDKATRSQQSNVIGDNLNCRLATVCLSTPKFLGKQSPRAQSEK